MKKAILATKVGMTQVFSEDGTLTPVTVLSAGPCVVTQVKTVETDGYDAIQVGFMDKKNRTATKDKAGHKTIAHRHGVKKAQQGHFEKAGVESKAVLREFRVDNASEYAPAQEIKVDIFEAGEKVDATAISKGKGFQGAIKRHNQHRGPMTHGSKYHRHAGSQMGGEQVTVQNLEVVRVDAENNLLLVKGAVPGPKKCLVTIRDAVKSE